MSRKNNRASWSCGEAHFAFLIVLFLLSSLLSVPFFSRSAVPALFLLPQRPVI